MFVLGYTLDIAGVEAEAAATGEAMGEAIAEGTAEADMAAVAMGEAMAVDTMVVAMADIMAGAMGEDIMEETTIIMAEDIITDFTAMAHIIIRSLTMGITPTTITHIIMDTIQLRPRMEQHTAIFQVEM
jgi:hypothetical protein